MGYSPVSTDIDYEKDGKQVSYLGVPHSNNSSAWGSILIPITVIKNGTGPTILFTSGVHGDEYEGPIALMKLARRLSPENINGRVLILPGLNLPALQAGTRLSPIDGKDLNRVFPGNPQGTISQIIAHYLNEKILPFCDAVIDLHSGGYSLNFVPYISMHYLEDEQQRRATLEAMDAFQAPVSMIINEIGGEGLLDYEVEKMGKIFLCAEMAGAGMFSPDALKIAETGIQNLLVHFDVMAGDILTRESKGLSPPQRMEIPGQDYYCMAPASGIFESFFKLGDWMDAGQAIGQIHFVNEIAREPLVIHAPRPGRMIIIRAPGQAEIGDCLAVIARHFVSF